MQVVQRLDHDTSGVLVFAKDSETSSRMHTLFREKRVQKIYVAICMGVPRTADSGGFSEYIVGSLRPGDEQMVVTAPVDRHPHIGPAACLNASGKPAQTIVTLLDSCEEPTWDGEHGDSWFQSKPHTMQGACVVQCKPLTGVNSPDILSCSMPFGIVVNQPRERMPVGQAHSVCG